MTEKKKNNSKRNGRPKSPAREIARAAKGIKRGRFTSNRLIALIIALLSAFGVYQYAPGRVLSVADGDTLTVYTEKRERKKVRLYGVDAPEGKQAWGPEARDFVNDLVFLQEVELNVMETDQYGRAVALVKLADGRILNEELVKNGHAWVYRRYCREAFCGNWIDMELAARAKKQGLWSQKNPVAPWNWRKRNN